MPELPEVETVIKNLNHKIKLPTTVREWVFWRKDLRFDLPIEGLRQLEHSKLLSISRRAKFIQFEFANHIVVSHLGMTGQWRFHTGALKALDLLKHDHLGLEYAPNEWLIYNDPRRFGFVELVLKHNISKYFENYGVEPFNLKLRSSDLTSIFKSLKSPIKSALMNQKFIVGVGNIYAAEALFHAKIRPDRPCSKISKAEYLQLWLQTEKVISKAIRQGGSTILNYRNSNNEEGSFQKKLFVYGRDGELCLRCETVLKNKVISGRASSYCPTCQK